MCTEWLDLPLVGHNTIVQLAHIATTSTTGRSGLERAKEMYRRMVVIYKACTRHLLTNRKQCTPMLVHTHFIIHWLGHAGNEFTDIPSELSASARTAAKLNRLGWFRRAFPSTIRFALCVLENLLEPLAGENS